MFFVVRLICPYRLIETFTDTVEFSLGYEVMTIIPDRKHPDLHRGRL